MKFEQIFSNLVTGVKKLLSYWPATDALSKSSKSVKFSNIKFKHQFKAINFYSIPESTLIILRRRLLFISHWLLVLFIFIWSII